jgi:hypothetical protein
VKSAPVLCNPRADLCAARKLFARIGLARTSGNVADTLPVS